MSPESLCSKCGAPVSHEVVGGFCTACLLEEGLSSADLAENPIALRYFGDYELIEEIARGGMGVVFKARQRSLNRLVAVKMILSGHLASEAQAQRFRAEARAAAALQHPGIVAIHEVGEHEGLLFFSMDYVAGQNLAQLVRDAPWAAARAAQCVGEIAGAIQYAHEQGVLHRDLKPSNVLIDANGRPHVTDFGLAKQLTSDAGFQTSDLTLTGQVLGSPNFMPPEQAAGKPGELTPAADAYSLGAILYHCLTGRPPFVAETLAQTLRMVAEQEPVSPSLLNASVPRDLETICLKCLEKDPKRRYATAQELAVELGRFLGNEPIHARPASVVLKVHRWCVRNKPLAISATAILALLLVVAIGSPIAAFRINRERQRAAANEEKARIEVAKNVAASLNDLAADLRRYGDLPRAEKVLREALVLQGKVFTNENPIVANTVANLANTLERQGKLVEAEHMLREAFTSKRAFLGDEDLSVFQWLHSLVEFLMRQGKYQEADELMNQMLPPAVVNQPKNYTLLSWRARFSARRGRWKEAVPMYSKAVEAAPTNHVLCHTLAPLLVATGDVEGYRRLCRHMLVTFKGTSDPVIADVVAKDCLILPPPQDHLPEIAEFAETAVNAGENHLGSPWFQLTKGLAEYRQGRPRNAAGWAKKSVAKSGKSFERDALGYAVLALANFQVGELDDARLHLAKALETADKEFPKSETGNLSESFIDRIIARTLMAEAKARIEGSDPGASGTPGQKK